jgi:hypothetical protein
VLLNGTYGILVPKATPNCSVTKANANAFFSGWSLGGLISLEISKRLVTSKIRVAGIVMVDSIYPGSIKVQIEKFVSLQPVFSDRCRPEIKLLVCRCMKKSAGMVESCSMVSWSYRSSISSISSSTSSISDSHSRRSRSESDRPSDLNPHSISEADAPPPVILIRCRDYVPVPQSSSSATEAVSRVDVTRESALLGWENYDYDMVEDVREIPGHHFNVFSEPHIEVATRAIEWACNKFEGISRSQEMDGQCF